MTDYQLLAAGQAADCLSKIFLRESAASLCSLRLEVSEDRCFRNTWVSMGSVAVYPRALAAPTVDLAETKTRLEQAFQYGSFEWCVPERVVLQKDLRQALGLNGVATQGKSKDRTNRRIDAAVDAVVHLAVRCGLTSPILDPVFVSRLPRMKYPLIMMDTSAVLQGGLDFVRIHLAERVRMGVPAIVQMEIVNIADRFLKQRRAKRASATALVDHILSQSGQRALVRLEMDHEVERPRLGADPLRGVVQASSDAEDKNLQLQEVQRSFVDRLILETAIQRRKDALVDTIVWLMMADQGLARMALSEGIEPLYFRTDTIPGVLGSTLSGVPFRPWPTGAVRAYPVSFATVLWECAVTFGAAKIVSSATGAAFEVRSMGERFPWQPYHAREDLLWVRCSPGRTERSPRQAQPEPKPVVERRTRMPRSNAGAFKFRPSAMLRLLVRVATTPLSDAEAMETVGATSGRTYAEYYRFLLAGGLVARFGAQVEATEALISLTTALRNADFEGIRGCLASVPSFGDFLQTLDERRRLERKESGIRDGAFPAYCALAEMCCAGVRLESAVILATPANPVPEVFAEIAISAYDAVRRGETLALTGSWLEHLVRESHIHPVRARQRLGEAKQEGLLHRYFEGSTPETRFPDRKLHLLENHEGQLTLREINLYHGDFLRPGQSAASIRLVRTTT